jgi:magnesium chelatase family protein
LFARAKGAVTLGVDGIAVDVEVDVSFGFPAFDIVGLLDTSVKESKERVRTAIKNSGFKLKQERVTINLAPADVRKDSAGLDLPIAMGLLVAYGLVPQASIDDVLFVAELSLEGELRGVSGVLPMAVQARAAGCHKIITAPDNANEALLVDGISVYAPKDLAELAGFLNGKIELNVAQKQEPADRSAGEMDDFADVQGQFQAKRALEIAAAGGHNVLMVGVPGAGKTMLARRLPSILPPLSREEALEVTKIYSIAGLLRRGSGLIEQRPFRSPHHTTSSVAMIGGGSVPRPGEVTLSHRGILFLDELPEFSKAALEVLRQPLEDGYVSISRVHASLTFPSRMILVTAMNPCPCGWNGDQAHECDCTPAEIKRYTRKISGPLLDRIDIHIRVPRVEYQDLISEKKAEASAVIRQRVMAARDIQLSRFTDHHIFCNGQMNHADLKKRCRLSAGAQQLLKQAFQALNLSARSYDRIIKVSQTIADLDKSGTIEDRHIAEAIQLRNDIGLDLNT